MVDAVARAAALLGLAPGTPGVAHEVRRLDRPGERYLLVHVGSHVACLDAAGTLMSSAATQQSPVIVSHAEALRLAGLPPGATAELVWQPSTISMSMMDPLWEVRSAAAKRYVDQRGRVHSAPLAQRPGG